MALPLFGAAACNSDASTETTSDGSGDTAITTTTAAETEDAGETPSGNAVNVDLFFDGALAAEVSTEDCTLSGGAEKTCYVITVAGATAGDGGPGGLPPATAGRSRILPRAPNGGSVQGLQR